MAWVISEGLGFISRSKFLCFCNSIISVCKIFFLLFSYFISILFQLSFYPKIFPNLSLSISIDTVKAFFAKVTSDPELTKKAKAIGTSDWKATEAFAKSLGFDFDDDDLIAYHKQNLPSSADLDEAELSSVSGGTVSVSTSAVVLAGVGTYITASSATQATSSGSW